MVTDQIHFRVFCKQCQDEGERSRVNAPSGGTSTLLASHAWYDEDGTFHYHDLNTHTATWSCSRGHQWIVSTRSGCPAGDFGPKRTVRFV